MLTDAYVGGGGYLKCLRKHFEFVKILFIPQKCYAYALSFVSQFYVKLCKNLVNPIRN